MTGNAPLACLFVAALIMAGCAAPTDETLPDPEPQSQRWSHEAWTEALTEPVYTDVDTEIVRISAADGTSLTMTVHLPAGLPADAKIPTHLQITPYQAGRLSSPVTSDGPPSGMWRALIERGAAYVEADARGTNGSEGCLDFGGSADRSDARVFWEWIVSQEWSNGRVVTDGISHPGMGSIVAHAAIPELTAALAHAPVVSYYQDQWILGARLEQINEFYQQVELSPARYVDPESIAAQAAPCTGETLMDFGKVDGQFTDKWNDRHLARHIDANTSAPVLLTHGFVDMNVHPDHSQMYWDALPEDYPKYAIFGWWFHSWPDFDGHPVEDWWDWHHRWTDATLHGIDNGLWEEPRVLVEDSTGVWHESHDWPLDGSELVTWHATPEGALNVTADEGMLSYLDAQGAQRGSWTGASVVFESPPLEQTMLVNGEPRVNLVASSDATETKWVAYLLDQSPDGSWARIAQGYADSRTHAGESGWDAMVPGTEYNWTIPLLPTAKVVEAGHKVVLLIASQDARLTDPMAPCWDSHRGSCYSPTGITPATSIGSATNTVHTGPTGTTVTFAWVDPETTAKPAQTDAEP